MLYSKTNFATFFLIFLFLCNLYHAGAQTQLFSYETYVGANGDTLRYRQLATDYDSTSKYPLVIFLHGSGERGSDNEAQLKWGVLNFASDYNMKMHPAIIIAPQCPSDEYWSNFDMDDMAPMPEETNTMKLLIDLINQVSETMPVDKNRIYITGLSLGGYGTFDAITRNPDLFAAAVPVCGAGDVSQASKIAHIPMWLFHGALDDVVDPQFSRNMVDALTKAGAHPGFTLYPEVGHFSWIAAYSDEMMMEWLFRQQK